MDPAHELLGLVAEATAAYEPVLARPGLLMLAKLGLHVRVGRHHAQPVPQGVLLSADILAGLDVYQQSIGVQCQGLGADGGAAAQAMVQQWAKGTLPVLAAACGDASGLAGRETLEVVLPGGRRDFDCLLGPVIESGRVGEGGVRANPEAFLVVLGPAFTASRPSAQHHWIEANAQRTAGGEVEVVCRLDSKEWVEGEELLTADVPSWPGTTPTYHARRQFIYCQPAVEEPELIVAERKPGLLGRLFGRR